jgi:hypothetical protein
VTGLAILIACAGGCATVINGRQEAVGLSSSPNGADVAVDNGEMHVITPTSIYLDRAHNHVFLFHKDGYEDASATVTSSTSGWVLGNILLGGIIGGVVDLADGAAYSFSNDTLNMNLVPKPADAVMTAPLQPQPLTQKGVRPAGGQSAKTPSPVPNPNLAYHPLESD